MTLKSYSFKTREEAIIIEKAVKKLFKKKTPTRNDFANKICTLCPHSCTTCTFCWGMFCKYKNTLIDYNAPLTILKTLISAYYDNLYMPTFYFLKTNICSICNKYDQGCNTISIGDACPSRYLVQMDSNEGIRQSTMNDDNMFGIRNFSEYDYINGRTYSKRAYPNNCHSQENFIRNSKPKLSINGENMERLVNKLFGIMKDEHT